MLSHFKRNDFLLGKCWDESASKLATYMNLKVIRFEEYVAAGLHILIAYAKWTCLLFHIHNNKLNKYSNKMMLLKIYGLIYWKIVALFYAKYCHFWIRIWRSFRIVGFIDRPHKMH